MFVGGVAAGLAAGTASCTAVQGGLLIGLVNPSCQRSDSQKSDRQGSGRQGSGRQGSGRQGSGRSRRDLAIVGAFLSARLLVHLTAGALLGLVGSAVQIGPRARAVLLVAAGIAVFTFAVRLLRMGGRSSDRPAHRDECATRRAPRPGEPGGVPRAVLLGLATILVPCGVTISMEIVAVSTGSALGGAAVLAGFAVGTAPVLAALGLLLRGVTGRRSGTLTTLAAVAALVVGVFTIGSGLRLGGWLPDLGSAAGSSASASATLARQGPEGVQHLTIWATGEGFRPGVARAAAGHPIEIVFRSHDNRGCTRTLSIDGRDVVLPVTGRQTVRLPPREAGRLRYACGMGMYVGFITFESIPAGQRTLQ
ncbi:hypothetical protein Mth01_11320 [Sphaerimonospora thailandensis]|uniref:Urease accessory protein UreH-like transmembrane domain-containing protein n=1 Tax=Sphaerimonospora thailandensis TaxID=795644 RepID=A0A8J3R6H5_9ACTN|nr:hypothetical protein Mth01_11320 [Sphaerimonospora thailandensis]